MTPINFNNEKWQNFLPKSYAWANSVNLSSTSESKSGGWHIVATSSNGDILCKNLKEKDELRKLSSASNWNAKSPIQLNCGHSFFVLTPVPTVSQSRLLNSRQFGMDAAKYICDIKLKSSEVIFCLSDELSADEVFTGFSSSMFNTNLFTSKKESEGDSLPENISFLGSNAPDTKVSYAASEAFTRTLQEAPPNWLCPSMFAKIAEDISKEGGAKCSVLARKELEKIKAGSIISVGAGSNIDPRLITIEIEGTNKNKTVCLVGKGVTFDSGGIQIKPSLGMGEMKYDMSGAAAVLGAADYFMKNKPPVNVICAIGATENMPGPDATRPSDVVTAYNGKTIEILNTDAEGRLVMADVLSYAIDKFKPDWVVDIATLTGAVLHCVGHVGAAVMSPDDDFAREILDASKAGGEQFCQLPMWPEFEKEVKSNVADLVNIAKPNVFGGTIMGAMFLKEFVGSTKWAHLDIAGAGWSCKTTGFPQSGGSAYGLRTMCELVKKES